MRKVLEINAQSMEAPNNVHVQQPDRLLRVRQVLQLVPVGKSCWYQGVSTGRYPKPVNLGPRCKAWRLSDIMRLIEQGVSV